MNGTERDLDLCEPTDAELAEIELSPEGVEVLAEASAHDLVELEPAGAELLAEFFAAMQPSADSHPPPHQRGGYRR